MLFGYLTLFVAFFLSIVAAYYSVLGLTAIFSAAVIPVIIMGGALETGKVVAAMWLHRNWHRAPWTYKVYLLPSLLALMLLTSMGTFGFLSKAHSDQNLVSGDVQAKIALYDEKIRVSRENIDANRRALKQLDAAVDQIMGRSTTEQGAERSVQIRRQQAPERQRLIREIEAEQKKISSLNEERAPIAAEVRKVEAEVGPIKYIAALVYEDTQDSTVLERAVRWVIILIVAVFDPLAIVLILAGSRHLEWERERPLTPTALEPMAPTSTETSEPPGGVVINRPGTWFRWRPFPPKPLPAYLTKPWKDHVGKPLPPVVGTLDSVQTVDKPVIESVQLNMVDTIDPTHESTKPLEQPQFIEDEFGYIKVDGKRLHKNVLEDNGYGWILAELKSQRVNAERARSASFGNYYPDNPTLGQMHVYTGLLPSRMYEYNGTEWVEVDRSISDNYTHNDAYINYLIKRLESGEVTLSDLTPIELTLVKTTLKNEQSIDNISRSDKI
jgi:cytochrome c oxidase subunit IV